jgi:hypothetical protein
MNNEHNYWPRLFTRKFPNGTVAHKNGPKLSKDTICPYSTTLPGALFAEGPRFESHKDFHFSKCYLKTLSIAKTLLSRSLKLVRSASGKILTEETELGKAAKCIKT